MARFSHVVPLTDCMAVRNREDHLVKGRGNEVKYTRDNDFITEDESDAELHVCARQSFHKNLV